MGIYLPPLAFMYAFVSRTAALMYGAAANPSGVFTPYKLSDCDEKVKTSLETKNPATLSYWSNASMTFVNAT